MSIIIEKFEQLHCCPFCGNEEFYTTNWMTGSCEYNQRFDGKDACNSEMYDNLKIDFGKRAYCNNCFEYLGNVETGVLSVGVVKQLKKLKVIS